MSESSIITINDKEYEFTEGETILDVASRNNIFIPTLCYLKGASPTGACRICLVEIEKMKNLSPSCSMPAGKGMIVKTDTPRVIEARRNTLALLMISGNHNCNITGYGASNWEEYKLNPANYETSDDVCPVAGQCKLQDLAYEYRVADLISSLGTARYQPEYPLEDVNPFIVRDFSRCILCGRCVAACNEIQVNNAISIGYRGASAKIVTRGDNSLKDSDCVFCGECLQACPVGALIPKKRPEQTDIGNKKTVRTTCPYCGVGCQINLHVQGEQIVYTEGVEDGAPNKGRLCVKGRFGYDFIYAEDRLKTPLIKENGEFREASWDEALDLIADKFKNIIAESGPDAVAGVSCARSSNEDSYQMQKLFRAVFKTNSIDHCART